MCRVSFMYRELCKRHDPAFGRGLSYEDSEKKATASYIEKTAGRSGGDSNELWTSAVEIPLRQMRFEEIIELGRRGGILAVGDNESAGRDRVDVECKLAAPYAVKGIPLQGDLRLLMHIVDDAQLVVFQIECIGRTEILQAKALDLILNLHVKMRNIGNREADAENKKHVAEPCPLFSVGMDEANYGADKENSGEDGRGAPALFELEGVEESEAAEYARVDANMYRNTG